MIKDWSFWKMIFIICLLGPAAKPLAALIFIVWICGLSPFGL